MKIQRCFPCHNFHRYNVHNTRDVYFSRTLLLVPCSSSRVGRLYSFDWPLRFDNFGARFCSELALDVTAYAEDIRNILLHTARKDLLSSEFSFYTAFDF